MEIGIDTNQTPVFDGDTVEIVSEKTSLCGRRGQAHKYGTCLMRVDLPDGQSKIVQPFHVKLIERVPRLLTQ